MVPKNKIRILHTESSPSLGGQELRVLLEMECLVAYGFESFLIAREDTQIVEEARRRKLAVTPIKIRSSIDPLAINKFVNFIKERRIGLVNAHNSKDGWNVALAARLCGVPVLRSRHIANPIRQGRISQLIYGPLCKRVLTTSESIRTNMIDKGISAEKIISVPTGVDIQKYTSGVRGRFRKNLGIPDDAMLIGQIAVLRGSKGPHIFVEAAQRLIAAGSKAWFVLAGEGPSRSVVARLLARAPSERIIMVGHRNDIPDILADLDVAVLAACQPEGVPQAVLQAFAARVPVIASDLGGINEVALDGLTAITVPPKDPEVLAKAISDVVTNPTSAAVRADRAYELACSHYSVDAMLSRMASLYASLALS